MNKRMIPAALCAALIAATFASGQERFRQKLPAPEPRPELRLPRLETSTLSNGLSMTVVFRDPSPILSVHLVIAAGEQLSPEKTLGLATLASGVFGQGTQLHSSAEIEERIERIGGSLAVSADQDVIILGFHFLEENLDEALDLIAEMVLFPLIAEREIKIVQSMISSEMSAQERNPDFVTHRLLSGLLFKGHPYEKFAFNRSAIRAWNAKDLQEFWNRYVRPNNTQIVLTGALNINTASRKISHAFNTWKPRDVTIPPLPPPRLPERERICFVDFPQSAQCTISAGTILPLLVPAERFSLLAIGQLLGGSTISSRLFLNLRENKGYAYETHSRAEFYRAGGAFTVRALVRPEVMAASVREIFSEILRFTKEAVPLKEIDEAKACLLGEFPIQLDRYDAFSGYVASMKSTGAGDEIWSRFPQQMLDVNADRILQTSRKYLSQPFIVVIAGSRELCRESLAEFDEVEIYDARGQYVETIKK